MNRKTKYIQMRKIEPIDIMRYYVTYIDTEKQILNDIRAKSEITRVDAYNKYVHKHMKIGRNFRSGTVHMVLGATENYFRLAKFDVEELSKIYASSGLLSGQNKNAVVAASKLLWLFAKEIIIMDNVNMKNLGAKDYESYVTKWLEKFETVEQEITDVINKYFINIDPVFEEKWFRMRIFDQYLLTQNKV